MGPAGPAGPPGPQGLQGAQGAQGPAGANAGVVMVAANGATFGTVLAFTPGSPTQVAVQDGGVWLQAPVNPDGLVPMSFYALYTDAACTSTPHVPLDTSPAPFFRLLQTVNAGDQTAYYAGNPLVHQAFQGLSPLGQPQNCAPTAGSGWEYPLLAGPQRAFDVTRFPAPFAIRH